MAKDISEELYAKIKESFDRKYKKAQLIGEPLHDVFDRIQSGAGTFRDADMYAVEVGSMISDSLKENITLDKLPNKTFYRNIAQKTLGVSLKDGYGMVSNIAAVIQEEMNEAAGIGLKAVKPKLEVKAVDKVVDGAVQAKTQDELDAALTEPVKTFTRRVVDDAQKANARLHSKAGLEVKVEREYDGVGLHEGTDACEWCLQRAGTWTYEKALANGVFERHEGCGCIIDYTSKKGERTRGIGAVNNEGRRTQKWNWEAQKVNTKQKRIIIDNKLAMANNTKEPKFANDWSNTEPRVIKKETIKSIREYAESKGVYIQTMKEFDGDPELLMIGIDEIAKWQKIMPIRERTSVNVLLAAPADFGETRGREIRINTLALRNRMITAKNINSLPNQYGANDIKDIFAHEYGHVFANAHNIGSENALELAREIHYTLNGNRNNFYEYIYDNVSIYALAPDAKHKIGSEIISEVFARHNANPNQFTDMFLEKLRKRVEKYG